MTIRVLHIIGQIGVGGCEMQLLELCRRMDQTRYKFGVCYYSPNPDNMVSEFQQAGADLFFVDKFSGISTLKFLRSLRGFIRDFHPDIIHTWQYSPNFWGRLAGLSCGHKRFISSVRTLRERISRPMYLLQMGLRQRTLWTANTQAVADRMIANLPIPTGKMRVIPNAVDLPIRDRTKDRAEVRAEFGLPDNARIVLTVGRLTEAKNYPMLLRTARRVIDRHGDVTFLCAGHGEKQSELEQLHKDLKLEGRLQLLGLRKDVPRLMTASDVFCLCSRWEGFPNVVVEAMASGLPVACTRVPGIHEVMIERTNGLLVDIDDDEAMAEAVMDLLSSPQRGRAMGMDNQARVRELFSWDNLVANMDSLYTDFHRVGQN